MRTTTVAGAAVLVVVATVGALRIGPSKSSQTPTPSTSSQPSSESRVNAIPTDARRFNPGPAAGLPVSAPASTPVMAPAPSRPADPASALAALDNLYGPPAGSSTDGDVQELTALRLQAKQEVIDQVAALGPGGARVVADLLRQSTVLRDRLLLLEGLGRLTDPEAVDVLAALFTEQGGFDERERIVRALARHQETAATETLSSILASGTEGRLHFAAVQGLSGRIEALPALSAFVQNGTDRAARLEAIRAVGLIGNESARAALSGFTQDAALPPSIRQSALRELRRSFGAAAPDPPRT